MKERAGNTRIVVLGGGAGGLELVARLGRRYRRRRDVEVMLVERDRSHVWKPLLHEVAAGSLDSSLDALGYRAHARRAGYRFFNGTVCGLDRERREVLLAPILDEDGSEIMGPHRVRYDVLVVALGSVSNDFGLPGVAERCIFLDELGQAERFRQRLLDHCLGVSRRLVAEPDADARVHVAIVGGGATGVELSAELYNAAAALSYYGLEVFDESRMQVTLLEAGPRILPALDEELADAARGELEALGVRVLAGTQVARVDGEGMHTEGGETIAADLYVWAAGVRGPDVLADFGGLEASRGNQLVVRPTLQTTRDERVFALGDCCSCVLPGEERPVPPRAQSAHQMAGTVFHNVDRLLGGRTPAAFVYRDHGSLVSLSRYSTVGSLMGNLVGGRMAIEGRLARLVYVSLYRMHLLAVHGWLRGLVTIVIGRINQVVRPRLKLH